MNTSIWRLTTHQRLISYYQWQSRITPYSKVFLLKLTVAQRDIICVYQDRNYFNVFTTARHLEFIPFQMNSSHTLTPYLFTVHFNIISELLNSSNRIKITYTILRSLWWVLQYFDFITLKIFTAKWKLINYSSIFSNLLLLRNILICSMFSTALNLCSFLRMKIKSPAKTWQIMELKVFQCIFQQDIRIS
jgi:hypothetical protein